MRGGGITRMRDGIFVERRFRAIGIAARDETWITAAKFTLDVILAFIAGTHSSADEGDKYEYADAPCCKKIQSSLLADGSRGQAPG